MTLTEKAREVFAADRYATELSGIEVMELNKHEAVVCMVVTPQHRNARGGVMGGALFTLADLAFAAAANSECVEDGLDLQWVSTESSIHYLSNTVDSLLTAHATAEKQGARTCLYRVEVKDSLGKLLAVVMTGGMRV